MSGREVASIVWIAVSSGTKLLAKLFGSVRRAKGQVKKAKKTFRKDLEVSGIPKEFAKELSEAYASAAAELLSIRKLMRLAREFED